MKSRLPRLLPTTLLFVALLLTSGPARAQLVRYRTATKRRAPPKKKSALVEFVHQLNAAMGTRIRPRALVRGIPEILAVAIRRKYSYSPPAAKGWIARTTKALTAFNRLWRSYSKRKAVVDRAVTKANRQQAGGQLVQARRTLLGVITPVTPTSQRPRRRRRRKRVFLKALDAELPALSALGDVALAQKDYALLLGISDALSVRRRVSNLHNERLLWIAENVNLRGLSAGQKNSGDIYRAVRMLWNRASSTVNEGQKLAIGWFRRHTSKTVPRLWLGRRKNKARRGQWVVFVMAPTKVSKKRLYYYRDSSYTQSYNCRSTNRIAGIDPHTGRFFYHERCQQRRVKRVVSMTANLAKPLPTWARKKVTRGRFLNAVWVLAKLRRKGPRRWRVSQAVPLDLPIPTSP